MLYYELKKVFVKTSAKIAIIFLFVVLGIVCYLSVTGVTFVNEEGETEAGFHAVWSLKKAKNEWSGKLTEEKVAEAIAENIRINETPQCQSEDVKQKNIAYGWKQGISDIRNMMMHAYGKFTENNYFLPDSLTMEDAENFYDNRVLSLQEWLNTEAMHQFSEKEKDFLIQKYRSLKTPLYYEYADGWKQLLENSSAILMIMVLVSGFLAAGIFPAEIQWKADAIFYSSRYGRDKAISSKIKAGILITTVVYWAVILLYFFVVLGVLGFQGADCAIQTSTAGWKSFYNITYWQEAVIVIIGGYIGTIFIMMLTMLVSAQTKSAVFAVIVPFIAIFVPSFLSGSGSSFLRKLSGLLPDQLLQMNAAFSCFNLYRIDHRIIGACELLPVLYLVGTLLLLPFLYSIYRKTAKR